MADREIIRPPFKADFPGITDAGFRFFQNVATYINAALSYPEYADNAAAVAGGLVVGKTYKTATGEVRIVV